MPRIISPYWLLFAAFFYALAYLIPNHVPPWFGFHADAWAGLVGLLLVAGVLWRSKASLNIGLVPVLIICIWAIIAFQYGFGLIEQRGVAWVNLLYLSGFLLAYVAGYIWERGQAYQCADFVFATALIASVVSFAMQLQQWLDINLMGNWLLYAQGRYYANLSQPNQLGSLMMHGVLACGWFYHRRKVPAMVSFVLAAILFFGLALANSRTSWVNAGFLLVALLFFINKNGVSRFFKPFLFLLAIYLIYIFLLPLMNAALFGVNFAEGVRSPMDSSRLEIWKMLLQGIMLKPWLGYGWGQVGHVQFMPGLPVLNVPVALMQSHNLVLDMLIWNGIPLGLLLLAGFAFIIISIVKKISNVEQLLMALFIAILLIHAMLEYPFEYAYFLIPTGLMLGALAANTGMRDFFILPHKSVWILFAPLSVFYGVTVSDYLKAETSFYGLRFEQRRIKTNIPSIPPDVVGLTQLRNAIIFARFKPEIQHSAADMAWAEMVVKDTPSTLTMYRLALMYAFAQENERALHWMRTAVRMSPPEQCYGLAAMWQAQAAIYPQLKTVSLDACPKLE